jgi:hypothetical protein
MWRPFRRTHASSPAGLLQEQRARQLVARAFRDLAGTHNGVIYDVPFDERPEAIPGSIFVRGSRAWRGFLDAREAVDVGQPAILFSLRVLDDRERTLVVDWGTTYPNTFFLIEPHDPAFDLTDPNNEATLRTNLAIEETLHMAPTPDRLADGWTNDSPLGVVLRELFGAWVYWSGPEPYGVIREVPLRLAQHEDTIWSHILNELVERFPQQAFDRALAYVNDWERELLGGPVPRAQSVFRTRLGMPILRDPRCVDRALRKLVNEGRLTVIAASLPGRPVFGQGRPIPDEISDEEFTRFLMG